MTTTVAPKEERAARLQSFRRVRRFAYESAASLVADGSRDPEQSAFGPDDDLPHARRGAEDR
ncbi:hypothetical protein AB0M11_06655 [Streptomyces sp. NPDC051987]|uniref:hypothetical protein n=1 Tax=Streptomyces sp. NPDC051987 TaxID=3155808 RepID=UPI003415E382